MRLLSPSLPAGRQIWTAAGCFLVSSLSAEQGYSAVASHLTDTHESCWSFYLKLIKKANRHISQNVSVSSLMSSALKTWKTHPQCIPRDEGWHAAACPLLFFTSSLHHPQHRKTHTHTLWWQVGQKKEAVRPIFPMHWRRGHLLFPVCRWSYSCKAAGVQP